MNWEDLRGNFQIVAPYLSEQFDDAGDMTLTVCPSSTSTHLWARFDFGSVSGIIRSSAPPPAMTGTACPFFWRGRESGDGITSFGESNTGNIVFLGDGKIKGRMEWFGGFDFVGKKVERKNVMWSKSVPGWKRQWRGFNQSSYESESVRRWGKWAPEGVPDQPSMSDTTACGGDGSDDEDRYNDGFDYNDEYGSAAL